MLQEDRDDTERRFEALDTYYSEHVLSSNKDELCAFREVCRKSTEHDFNYGVLPHVGRHFSLFDKDAPLRILVIGLSWGEGEYENLQERRAGFDDIGAYARTDRSQGYRLSPHLAGTEQAVRLLLGMSPGIEPETRNLDVGGQDVNLYQCFAFTNRTLCGSTKNNTSDETTPEMIENCSKHIINTIKILKPTHLICQGAESWNDIPNFFADKIDVKENSDYAYVGKTSFGFAFGFYHPSAR